MKIKGLISILEKDAPICNFSDNSIKILSPSSYKLILEVWKDHIQKIQIDNVSDQYLIANSKKADQQKIFTMIPFIGEDLGEIYAESNKELVVKLSEFCQISKNWKLNSNMDYETSKLYTQYKNHIINLIQHLFTKKVKLLNLFKKYEDSLKDLLSLFLRDFAKINKMMNSDY